MPAPAQTVRDYLSAMEDRDLERARALLADGFTMEFPGPVRMAGLDELLAWAGPRYRFVRKTYERFDTCTEASDSVVYCFGTLGGEWPDGTPFSGIRFIDRFTVRDGRLVDQTVWNDLGEVRHAGGSVRAGRTRR
jgi:ketosteroid isomerase-like protein